MFVSDRVISLFVGVVSGIITTFLLWLVSILFKKVLLPWFQGFVYKGVYVRGNWIYKNKENISGQDQEVEISLDLKQKAHQIFGSFRAYTRNSKEYTNYYNIRGIVKDNYLLFTYSAQRKDRTGLGSFLLRVSNGGTQLIGNAIFTPDANIDDSSVASRQKMIFKRD